MNHQSIFNTGYRMLGVGAWGRSREMIWGAWWEGGSGLGTHVHLWWIHVNVWQNQYNILLYFFSNKQFYFIYFFFFYYFFTLQYCIGFGIHWHESTTCVHEFPTLNPPPTSLTISSLWVIPVRQPQASCIQPRLVIRFLHDSIHVSMPFSQIIPPSPSPTESKSLFYTSVSLLLSRIQGYHYHLSKFHIYVLVYCIGVFLSGLLHSV